MSSTHQEIHLWPEVLSSGLGAARAGASPSLRPLRLAFAPSVLSGVAGGPAPGRAYRQAALTFAADGQWYVLRHVVAWLVETADVLADPTVVIAGLVFGGDNPNPNERNTR